MRPSAVRQPAFYAAVALYAAGVVITYADGDGGRGWLAWCPGAGRVAVATTSRGSLSASAGCPGSSRRACCWAGWLGLGGALSLAYGEVVGWFQYDAVLHAVLLGFVFSMIFGHAPIIIPALTKIAVPFNRRFYLHLALLHVGLAVRVGSDVLGSGPGENGAV